MFQHYEVECLIIQDLDELLQYYLIELHMGKVLLIQEEMYLGEDVSLRRFLKRGSMTDVLDKVLDGFVIESNNLWIYIYICKGGGKGLCMISKYTQVENYFGLNLIYSHIMKYLPVLPNIGVDSCTSIIRREY